MIAPTFLHQGTPGKDVARGPAAQVTPAAGAASLPAVQSRIVPSRTVCGKFDIGEPDSEERHKDWNGAPAAGRDNETPVQTAAGEPRSEHAMTGRECKHSSAVKAVRRELMRGCPSCGNAVRQAEFEPAEPDIYEVITYCCGAEIGLYHNDAEILTAARTGCIFALNDALRGIETKVAPNWRAE